MKKKLFAYAVIPATALALLGAGLVSAHGFGFGMSNLTPQQIAQNQTDRFTQEATLLGVTVDEVKAAWAKGQTLEELATSKGITADQLKTKMQELRQTQMKAQLQTLVDQGVITQDQMNQRLSFMQTQAANNKGRGFGRHMGGMGMMGQ